MNTTKQLIEQLEKESGKKVVLKENVNTFLYHSTSFQNAFNILKSGLIKTYESILKDSGNNPEDWYDDVNYGKYVYVSPFMHNQNNFYGLSDLDVTFVIDASRLNKKAIKNFGSDYEGGTIGVGENIPLNKVTQIILHKPNKQLEQQLKAKGIKTNLQETTILKEVGEGNITPYPYTIHKITNKKVILRESLNYKQIEFLSDRDEMFGYYYPIINDEPLVDTYLCTNKKRHLHVNIEDALQRKGIAVDLIKAFIYREGYRIIPKGRITNPNMIKVLDKINEDPKFIVSDEGDHFLIDEVIGKKPEVKKLSLQEKQIVGPKGKPKRFHLTPKNHKTISKPQALIDKCVKAGIKDKLDGVSLCELTIKEKGEEKKYYRVQTHRAACPWYDSPESISIEHIKFIESTG